MMDMNGLFVWTLGSVIQVIQLISTLKELFISCFSITWIVTHWIQGKNRILTITWITRFLFISCLDQFCLYFPKSIKGLFVWTLGSVIRMIQLISALKELFFSCFSITWIVTHWIQGKNRILTITWITRFLFISCLDQFCLYFPKSSNNGIERKHK